MSSNSLLNCSFCYQLIHNIFFNYNFSLNSHAEGGIIGLIIRQHGVQEGAEHGSGHHARQHGGSDNLHLTRYQRARFHQGPVETQDQGGQGLRAEGPDKRTGLLWFLFNV